jgi:DNA-binding NtrC family response regulator
VTRAVELRRELVIPVRAGIDADVKVAVERLGDESSRSKYERALVFVVRAEDADAEIARVRAKVTAAGHSCSVFAPPALRGTDAEHDVSALAVYLAETRPAKMGRESYALDIVLQSSWPELAVACGMVLVLREEVRIVDPGTGNTRRPEVSPALARRLDLRTQPTGANARQQLIGSSTAMKTLVAALERYAPLPFPVLLEGETGVGKELCAQLLHDASGRKGNIIAVNGALLDPVRAEDELCGHVKGAFTGADANRIGRIREANGGTFFLDELLAVPTSIQAMLLRTFNHAMDGALEVTPLGQEKSHRLDVRLVTAIQPCMELELASIRDDLLFRVTGIRVEIPPLRDRGDDVLEIAEAALARLYDRHKCGPKQILKDAQSLLRACQWPGNVRQLHGVVRQAWAANNDTDSLTATNLRPYMPAMSSARPRGLRAEVYELARRRVEAARRDHPRGDNAAARALGFDKGQAMKRYLSKCANDAEAQRKGSE